MSPRKNDHRRNPEIERSRRKLANFKTKCFPKSKNVPGRDIQSVHLKHSGASLHQFVFKRPSFAATALPLEAIDQRPDPWVFGGGLLSLHVSVSVKNINARDVGCRNDESSVLGQTHPLILFFRRPAYDFIFPAASFSAHRSETLLAGLCYRKSIGWYSTVICL